MMKKKHMRLLGGALGAVVLFAAVLLFSPITEKSASAAGASPFSFTLIANTHYSITATNKTITQAVIPTEYNGLPVDEIATNGFANCTQLERVYIPGSIKKVGTGGFLNCEKLETVNMTEVTTIGQNAFAMCDELEVVALPDTVTTVSASAFRLSSPTVCAGFSAAQAASWTNWLSNFSGTVMYDCSDLVCALAEDENGDPAYSVVSCQFVQDSATLLYLDYHDAGDGAGSLPIVNIQSGAFESCEFDCLAVGMFSSHYINIESMAFSDSNIKTILLDDNVTFFDELDGTSTYVFMLSTVEQVVLPDELDTIPFSMFSFCSELTSVSYVSAEDPTVNQLSPNVTRIEEQAFAYCTALEYIYVPANVVKVYDGIFYGWGSTDIPQTIDIDFYEDELPVSDTESESYDSYGWNENWDDGIETVEEGGNATIIFKQPVILDAQGGTGGTGSIKPVLGSLMPEATAPTRTGYDFLGYYSESEGLGYQYYTAGMVSARYWDIEEYGVTLYAHWEEQYFQINFVENPYVTFVSTSLGLDGYGTVFVPYGATVDFSVVVNPEYSQSAPSISAEYNNSNGTEYPTLTLFEDLYTISDITDTCDITVMGMQLNQYTVTLVYNAYAGFGIWGANESGASMVSHGSNFGFQAYMKSAYDHSNATLLANGDYLVMVAGDIYFTLYDITENIYITASSVPINQYTVTLATNEYVVYTLLSNSTVTWGQTFSFTYTMNAAYTQSTPQFSITDSSGSQVYMSISYYNGVYSVAFYQSTFIASALTITVAPMELNQYTVTVQENNQRSGDYSLSVSYDSWGLYHGGNCNLMISVMNMNTEPVPYTLTVTVNGVAAAQFSGENGNIYDYTIYVTGNLSIVVTLS
jgi:hypothetical protein